VPLGCRKVSLVRIHIIFPRTYINESSQPSGLPLPKPFRWPKPRSQVYTYIHKYKSISSYKTPIYIQYLRVDLNTLVGMHIIIFRALARWPKSRSRAYTYIHKYKSIQPIHIDIFIIYIYQAAAHLKSAQRTPSAETLSVAKPRP